MAIISIVYWYVSGYLEAARLEEGPLSTWEVAITIVVGSTLVSQLSALKCLIPSNTVRAEQFSHYCLTGKATMKLI